MGHRLSKIYTRTGDRGSTGLGDGSRISKAAPRVQCLGDIDEVNSIIGLLLCFSLSHDMRNLLQDIQHTLFDLGGELSLSSVEFIGAAHAQTLEAAIDRYNAGLPPLKEFVLPGGSRAAATCHVARSVCRRAERSLAGLAEEGAVNPHSLSYINRLSDLLFVLARTLARDQGGTEILWDRSRSPDK
ncbi:MAG: cob(I)yrinic acid a,c-diamide adenosyltransferase [Gammaproteobacteria bacterium]|nr:cob(I)yrinic acid a,c-diamide adenosyltransferase [Gammaproteobacteria bacterium]